MKPPHSVLTHIQFNSGIVKISKVYYVKGLFMMSSNIRSIRTSQLLVYEGTVYHIYKSTERNKQKIIASVSVYFEIYHVPIIFVSHTFDFGEQQKKW